MRGKSKSTVRLDGQNPQVIVDRRQLIGLYEKQFFYCDLLDRVNRSKPLLESIYGKIKRKEQKLNQSIKQLKQRLRANSTLTKEYRQLYQEGLRIIQRNGVVDRYKGYSNYLKLDKTDENKNKVNQNRESSLIDKIKQKYKQQENNTGHNSIEAIKEEYRYELRFQNRLTKEQIYQMYRNKICQNNRQIMNQSKIESKQNSISAKQLSRTLIDRFQNDLRDLQRSRRRGSLNQEEKEMHQIGLKQRYILMQRQKLLKI